MMLRKAQASTSGRPIQGTARPKLAPRPRQSVVAAAIDDTNLLVNLFASTSCGAAAAAVTLVTAENK